MNRKLFLLGVWTLTLLPSQVLAAGSNTLPGGVEDPLPLSGPTFQLADDAYRAYARGDYRRALREATEASRLRPDVARLHDLITQSRQALRPLVPGPTLPIARARPAVAKVAITSIGFAEADAAYGASRRRDFDAALVHARRAVQQAPSNLQYRLLLIDTLLQMGRFDDAANALDESSAAVGESAQLTARSIQLQQQRAAIPAKAMYRALASSHYVEAIQAARQAVALAPDNPVYRLLLTHTLLLNHQFEDAVFSATETLAKSSTDANAATALVLRAVARQRTGQSNEATRDFDMALARPELSDATRRTVRLLAAESALALQLPERALSILGDASASTDVAIAARRRVALAQLQRSRVEIVDVSTLPGLDCSTPNPQQSCLLVLQEALVDPGYALATAAYAAFNAGKYDDAIDQIRRALERAPDNRNYQLLYLNAALKAGRFKEAEAAASAALQSAPHDAPLLAQRGYLRQRLGDVTGAQADFSAALAQGGLPLALEIGLLVDTGQKQAAWRKYAEGLNSNAFGHLGALELAYLAARSGDDNTAVVAFAAADQKGELPPTALQDAGYAAMRNGRDQAAIGYFHRQVDAAQSLQLRIEPQLLFDTRRTIATVSREGGVIASLSHRGIASTTGPTGSIGANEGNALQAGIEGHWRPFGYQGGRTVELFARAFETLHDGNGGASGSSTAQGAVGARWKPLAEQNLVGSVARLIPLGSAARSDWLTQLGYSGGRGTDLRVDVPSWWTAQWFAEAGHYFEHAQTYGIASTQFGRSIRFSAVDPNLILFPHLTLDADYNSLDRVTRAIGAGAGVNMRYWFREDRYSAPKSFLDLSLQYRFRLEGDARARGVFMTTTLSY